MAKGKVESTKSGNWGSFGGNTKMHGWSGTGKQEPGHSSQEGSGSKRGIEPKAGGSGGNYYSAGASNTDYAGTQMAGVSGRTKTGGDKKFATGGDAHMHSNTGSRKAVPGQSSQ